MIHLNELWNALATWNPILAYCALFGVGVLENVLPFLPGDAIIVFGSYLIGRGHLHFVPVFVGTTLGSTCGFMLMYYLGTTKGRALLTRRRGSWVSKRRIRRAERWFGKYGDNVVLINRFLAGGRSVIALLAGIGNMRPHKAALFATLSAIVWNLVLISLGMWLGTNWQLAWGILTKYNITVLVLLLVVIAVLARRRLGFTKR